MLEADRQNKELEAWRGMKATVKFPVDKVMYTYRAFLFQVRHGIKVVSGFYNKFNFKNGVIRTSGRVVEVGPELSGLISIRLFL